MAILAGTLLAAALATAPCRSTLCQAEALEPWFNKLARVDHAAGVRPLHILQIGDSHTAGDAITGAWRETLQRRHGSGGRGVMPPGRPYRGYVSNGATATMSADWTVKASAGPLSVEPRPPIGLSGFTVSTATEGATMSLTADAAEAFDRFTICALTGPGNGALTISMGFVNVEFDLSSFSPHPECRTLTAPEPQYQATITAHGGPVAITSWASFRDHGGVAISNVGIVGSQFVHFGRTDEAVVAEELRAYRPDLIVIAFGTNEGFAPRIDPATYELALKGQIARLRRLAGDVPMLMLGAPDAGTRNAALAANAPGEAVDCNVRVSTLAEIVAALRAEAADGDAVQTPVDPEEDPARRPLFIPPGMRVVREVQRHVAAETGIAFWDWQAAMGGNCAAVRFVRADPPLMRGDFVHYTRAGGAEIARMLDADLAAAAPRSREAR